MLSVLAWVAAAALAACVAYELWRHARMGWALRIAPEQLRARLEGHERLTLVDLRNWQDVLASGEVLPMARVATAGDVVAAVEAGRMDGELILYCG